MTIQIDQQTAERAHQTLRNQQARHLDAANQARNSEAGGLIADPAIVAQHLEEEAERCQNAAREIERAMGWTHEE